MKGKLVLLSLIMLVFAEYASAQQDPMFTQYMYNTLLYNPAYAGSREVMSMNFIHRDQWFKNIDGAPRTQSFTIHSPLKNERIALGGSMYHDEIGVTRQIGINIDYAYRIPVGEKSTLSFGIKGGILNWRSDWDKLNVQVGDDNAFQDNPNFYLPNVGFGIYYYHEKFYVGAAAPHLINHDLVEKDRNIPEGTDYAKQYRHYFATAGIVLPIGANMKFKPSVLVKYAGQPTNDVSSPVEVDVDAMFFFYDALHIGVSYRTNASFDFLVGYQMKNGLLIGGAYDYTITKLNDFNQGSYELMLGYEFGYKKSKIVTPRYF